MPEPILEARVLSVKQPWAWAIINGGKDVENRTRNLAGSYRGPVAIHTSREFDHHADDSLKAWELIRALVTTDQGYPADDSQVWSANGIDQDDPRFAIRGHIIGIVNLRAAHHADFCTGDNAAGHLCTPWAEPDVHHLELTDPRPLRLPIPYRGGLGLRRLDLTTLAHINNQL